jgi:aerobic-type carbon monoxide dehydrogenase small subunit (CoxS/CutS family)
MTAFELDGRTVEAPEDSANLLDALREHLGCHAVKDGCSPQGQCGCCTVLIDGAARVSCVTPLRRVAGRRVQTAEGLDDELARRWAAAFVGTGASQCGFCTPGIVVRLAALEGRGRPLDESAVRGALGAHLCRCTGWQSIVEAAMVALGLAPPDLGPPRDPLLASWRAQLEGPQFQATSPAVVLGAAAFAEDTAPGQALVAVPDAEGYALARTLGAARAASDKVQGRNSTVHPGPPLALPPGEFDLTLRTSWVEPAYLEPDASWCLPGGVAASPLANGGAFGGKRHSPVPGMARRLADEHGEAVRVVWSREDVVRHGHKRPPVALGLRPDGTGVLRVARTAGSELAGYEAAVAAAAPGISVEFVDIAGPPVAAALRAAGWAEASAATAALNVRAAGGGPGSTVTVTARGGGVAAVAIGADGAVSVEVTAGAALDPVTLRSYCLGAVHQALGWVWREGIAVDERGEVLDLTIRSFGILSAKEMPEVHVAIAADDRWPRHVSDAVFAATAAAAWLADGLAPQWPTRRGARTAASMAAAGNRPHLGEE